MRQRPDDEEPDWDEVDDSGRDGDPGWQAPRRRRNHDGASTVFSLRLELSEHEALIDLAAERGIGPTVLARAFVREALEQRR